MSTFKDDGTGSAARTEWIQERADRIRWIHTALTDPDEIRGNHQFKGREAYLLEVRPDNIAYKQTEFYYVSVKPEPSKGCVIFLTGYPVKISYWKDARQGTNVFYRRRRR